MAKDVASRGTAVANKSGVKSDKARDELLKKKLIVDAADEAREAAAKDAEEAPAAAAASPEAAPAESSEAAAAGGSSAFAEGAATEVASSGAIASDAVGASALIGASQLGAGGSALPWIIGGVALAGGVAIAIAADDDDGGGGGGGDPGPGDDNDPPVITVATAVSIEENKTVATTVSVVDPDGTQPSVTVGGDDGALFSLVGGNLVFNTAPDFEAPGDKGGNNVYNVTITATDGVNPPVSASVAVTVTDSKDETDPGGGTGQGIILTVNTDIKSGSLFTSSPAFTPGGDDRINTLQDEDQLTGTGDSATLTATLGNANDSGGTIITPTFTNIKNLNFAFTGSEGSEGGAVREIDLQDSSGLDAINIFRISNGGNAIKIDNITEAGADNLSLDNISDPADVAFLYQDGVLSAAGDEKGDDADVTLKGVNLNSLQISDVAAGGFTEGFEKINLKSIDGTNAIADLNAAQLRQLTITGDKDLGIGAGQLNEVGKRGASAGEFFDIDFGAINNFTKDPLHIINAGAFTGDLTIDITGFTDAQPDPQDSGKIFFLNLTGGSGDDDIIFDSAVTDANIVFDGGAGNDTISTYASIQDPTTDATANKTNPTIRNFENLEVRANTVENITVDVSELEGLKSILLRNESGDGVVTLQLNEVSDDLSASGIGIEHGVTGGNATVDTIVKVRLDEAAGTETTSIQLNTNLNIDPRFNFELDTDGATKSTDERGSAGGKVENITIKDTDNESNTIKLTNWAEHTGALLITGGLAEQFLHLDATANAYRLDQTGKADDGGTFSPGAGFRNDVGAGVAERLVFESITSTDYKGNVILRVSDSLTPLGGQKILFGAGNDVLIFDQIGAAPHDAGNPNKNRAGLTISDTANGGEGKDILGLDGHGIRITIGETEWTNVSNFETIRPLGNAVADDNSRGALKNAYNLVLTDDLLKVNGVADGEFRRINIINDNDSGNDTVGVVDDFPGADADKTQTGGSKTFDPGLSGKETGVTIDARDLAANVKFNINYNGEEGASRTADRFIFLDANVNAVAIIDGGAVYAADNKASNLGNEDVLEVRNQANVTLGDLANIKNVGELEFTNDTAVAQSVLLQLDNATIDALVNSTQAASLPNKAERLEVYGLDSPNVANAVTNLTVDAFNVTSNALDFFISTGALDADGGTLNANGGLGTDTVRVNAASSGNKNSEIDLGGQLAGQVDVVQLFGGIPGDTLTFTGVVGGTGILTITSQDGLTIRNIDLRGVEQVDVGGFLGVQPPIGGIFVNQPTTPPPVPPVPPGGGVPRTVNINASGSDGAPPNDSDIATPDTVTYNFATGNYTYNISGFGLDDVLDFFGATVANLSLTNGVTNDGNIQITADIGVPGVTLNLTGIDPLLDAQVFSVNSFNNVFGAGSLVA